MGKGILVIAACFALLAACKPSAGGDNSNENYAIPEAGTVVAKGLAETDDQLNHFRFSVFIKAGEQSNKGIYDVLAVYGHDSAASQFTMPRGGERLKPLLKKSDEPSTFIVGFHYGSDTAFYDYYEVSGARGSISMRYLKAYSFK